LILDTSFLGALADREPDARELAAELELNGQPRRIPSMVVWEVYHGLEKANDDPSRLKAEYETLLDHNSTAEMDRQIAQRAGALYAEHDSSDDKKSLNIGDSIVAAHGLALGEAVVTNDSDFRDVDGLEVVSY